VPSTPSSEVKATSSPHRPRHPNGRLTAIS
jgi:hypothetical protein